MLEHNYRCLVRSIKSKEYLLRARACAHTSCEKKNNHVLFAKSVSSSLVGGGGIEWNYSAHGRDKYTSFSVHIPMCSIINVYILTTTTILGIGTETATFYSNDIILIYFAYNSRMYVQPTIFYFCVFKFDTHRNR